MAKRCRRCKRVLRDDESLSRGFGPTCFRLLFGPANKLKNGGAQKKTRRPAKNSGDVIGPLLQVNSYEELLEQLQTMEVVEL